VHAFIGTKLLSSNLTQPTQKPFEIYDTRLAGFTLRVQPTGARSFYTRFGRNRRFAIGKVGALLPDEARDRCKQVLGNVAHGRHPLHGLNGEGLTLGQFIDDKYVPWVTANRPRTAANTLEKLKRHFGTWYAGRLLTITVERIELWKIRRVNTGRVPTTVIRDIFTLSSVLRRAVRLGKLTIPFAGWISLELTAVPRSVFWTRRKRLGSEQHSSHAIPRCAGLADPPMPGAKSVREYCFPPCATLAIT
jgi:hypothetical protein